MQFRNIMMEIYLIFACLYIVKMFNNRQPKKNTETSSQKAFFLNLFLYDTKENKKKYYNLHTSCDYQRQEIMTFILELNKKLLGMFCTLHNKRILGRGDFSKMLGTGVCKQNVNVFFLFMISEMTDNLRTLWFT